MTQDATHHPLTAAWSATSAATVDAKLGLPFTHRPRPAFVPTWQSGQRWYAGGGSGRSLRSATDKCDIALSVNQGSTCGELTLTTLVGADDFHVYVTLRPETMRELARCLVDAAAGLERAEPAAAARPRPVYRSAAA